jgi:glycosyltransferase involved in cell wall biosynthesis
MRILFVIDRLGYGGKERQLIELLKGLKRRENIQFRSVILSDNIYYSYVRELESKIDVLKRKIPHDPRILIKLYKICKEFQPDIIHSWESMCSVYAVPVAKILGVKFINGMIRNAHSKLKPFGSAWIRARLTFPWSDVILANSYAGLKSFNVPSHKGYCIHNGFDLRRLKKLENGELIRKKFQIHTPKVVGMVARFHARKDFETFVLSAKQILQKRKDVTFLAIGDGRTLRKCMNLVNGEFHDNIKFLGRQKDVESIVNILDVGVLASYAEGISNSIMEYMSLVKPVVATNHGGTSEIVVDNATGFLIGPKNVEEMARKIEFLLDNEVAAKAMGNAGKERLLKEFGLEKMTDRYVELYHKCIAQ